MADDFSNIDCRADQLTVTDDLEDGRDFEYYTMTCPECGSDGVYDERGDVICSDESCGVMIAGPESAAIVAEDHSGTMDYLGVNSVEKTTDESRYARGQGGPTGAYQ